MMSTRLTVASLIRRLNTQFPTARIIGFGTLLNDIITQFNALRADVAALRSRQNSGVLSSAGLAIKAGGSPAVKAGSAFSVLVDGVPIRKAANTDMAALAGTLATAKSAAWAFYLDGAGALSASAKTADANTHDAALALLPAPPDNQALVGIIVIDNATGANFIGGTTALDTASLTVTYYNATGPTAFAADLTSADLAALNAR